jgi:hypothetical protein
LTGDGHSLVPRGWQRSGALATLFVPFAGSLRGGFLTPTELIAPAYAKAESNERTHQTLLGISGRLGLRVATRFAEGQEAQLGAALAAARTGVTLVCWEHTAIPVIAGNIAPGAAIPGKWPDTRFDVVWVAPDEPVACVALQYGEWYENALPPMLTLATRREIEAFGADHEGRNRNR